MFHLLKQKMCFKKHTMRLKFDWSYIHLFWLMMHLPIAGLTALNIILCVYWSFEADQKSSDRYLSQVHRENTHVAAASPHVCNGHPLYCRTQPALFTVLNISFQYDWNLSLTVLPFIVMLDLFGIFCKPHTDEHPASRTFKL